MELGVSKRCVTPLTPMRLCGFAYRKGAYVDVAQDIFLRVHYLVHDENRALFIYGDFMAWSLDFVLQAETEIEQQLHLKEQEVFFVASHNHSGPPTGQDFTDAIQTPCESYRKFLLEELITAVKSAVADLEPVTLHHYDGVCNFNVYRRMPEAVGAQMLPNYAVPADNSLTAITYCRNDGTKKGILIHYQCHASLNGDNRLNPDYPGIALNQLDLHYNGCVSMFMQGCTADLRANSVLGSNFRSGSFKDTCQFAMDFYKICIKLIEGKGEKLAPCLTISKMKVPLVLENTLSRSEVYKLLEVGSELERDWAKKLIEKQFVEYEMLDLGLVQISDKLHIFFANAELSQFYSAYVKSVCKHAIFACYTNGMVGYICTAEQINNGGYEPIDSAKYFALAGTYPSTIQSTVCGAIDKLAKTIQ